MANYRYEFRGGAEVLLSAPTENSSGALEWTGPDILVEKIKRQLKLSYGRVGHTLSANNITPSDLHFALQTSLFQALYSPKLLEGKPPSLRVNIPKGAMS